MAEVIEERPVEDEDVAELPQEPQEVTAEEEQPQEEELPEKYRNKSPAELARMHQEAEALIGRQSQEVGELRKTFDQYIQTQLNQAPKEPEEEIDFFTDPDKAVAQAIESHPKLKEAERISQEYQKATALNSLQSKHPDMKSILEDSGFQSWVTGSNVRKRLFQQADQQYDYEAADELFTLWKERQQVAKDTVDLEKKTRKQQAAQASTGGVRGSGEPSSKKVYRRADIIKLMKDDPDRYAAMGDEIRLAYSQGRVK